MAKKKARRKQKIAVNQGNGGHEIGYGKPPKEYQWPPGQSGNPKGQPKHRTHLWTYYCKFMQTPLADLAAIDKERLTAAQRTALMLVEKGVLGEDVGSERMARYCIDREEGKAVERLIIGTEDALSDEQCAEIREVIARNYAAVTLDNEQIRYAGRAILMYKPLPAPKDFHRSQAKCRWLFGGNRSGKSEGNIGFDLCSFALGVHPFRRTPKNATIWTAANTWDLVGKLLWAEKIKMYLPMSQVAYPVWHNKAADIPKELCLVNGNRIEFKAYEQGRKAFEGRAIDAFYGDEQCKSDSEGIWQEIQARLMDKNGFSAQSMTPILYQRWLEERIRDLPDTDEVFYADLNDNRKSRGGYVDDKEIDELLTQWPAEVQETRIKGRFAAFLGAVYKTFSRDTHVIKPFEIPADWTRYRSIDFGYNNPFACLWLARDPDSRWYVYAEHYQAKETLAYHAERIKQISKSERYAYTWTDHDLQDQFELRQLGVQSNPAQKDVHLGIETVQAALKIQPDGKPRLFIFNTCKHTIDEMIGYRWAEGTENKDAIDEPLKVNDHTIDALRYGLYGVEGKSYFSPSDLS